MKRGRAIWLVLIISCCFFVYRIANFSPQPLDASNTLRPLLNAWFISFLKLYRNPETAYVWWRVFGLLLMTMTPVLALLNYSSEPRKLAHVPRMLCSRGIFFTVIAASLVVCRFPTLLDYQINPDEGEFLSAAQKLFYNSNFFDSVDCGTSGPLNIYPLMLPAAIGISPDYASSRLLALTIAFSVICLLYASFRRLSCDRVARLAILPVAQVFAGLEHPNLVHYSSEQIPLIIIAGTFYFVVRVFCNPALKGVSFFVLGLLTGCAFFSKMQSVPIVGTAALIAVLFAYTKKGRAGLPFLAGAAALPFANAALCLATGVWKDFWIPYIVSNQRYTAQVGEPFLKFSGFLVKTGEIRFLIFAFLSLTSLYLVQRWFRGSKLLYNSLLFSAPAAITALAIFGALISHLTIYDSLAGAALFAIAGAFLFTFPFRQFRSAASMDWATVAAALITLAALYSIYKPHRLFPHYLLLLLPPLSILAGLLVIRLTQGYKSAAVLYLLAGIGVANQGYLWVLPLLHEEWHPGFHNIVPTIRPPESDFVSALTRPNDRIFVWGWTADPYLGSGRVSPTRDLNLFYEFSGIPEIASYYTSRLAKDLRADPPELFIDAVGRESWIAQDARAFNFSQFPELKWFVEMNYLRLPDAFGQRYYLRRDLAGRFKGLRLPRHCAANALRCLEFPERIYTFEGALISTVAYLPPLEIATRAHVAAEVIPMAREGENATVFGSGAKEENFQGFRFQNVGEDGYRLYLGLGDRWAASNTVRLPYGKKSSVEIEFDVNFVTIRIDGSLADTLQVPSEIVNSSAPITVGSWTGGTNRFTGLISFFEID